VAPKFGICVIPSRHPVRDTFQRTREAGHAFPSYPVSPLAPHGLGEAAVRSSGHNTSVDLARISWLLTVAVCLVVVLILVLQGYLGYAAVTFAVAISAGINLS
jgi:hypothetical protein